MTDKIVLKVYGPYISRKDGRKRVIIRYSDLSMSVRSYARFLYEQKNGKLDKLLTVDHIDEDFRNDNIENLQPLTRKENIQKAWKAGTNKPKEWFTANCQICNNLFTRPKNIVDHNLKQGKAGPFCSRKCAGTYNQKVQMEKKVPLAELADATGLRPVS